MEQAKDLLRVMKEEVCFREGIVNRIVFDNPYSKRETDFFSGIVAKKHRQIE
ncbi:hypothetical protein [Cuneatibacter sp. NSJ-177]|uniref:hypothetical protein n=1 Tax=Cuneatibacter sp. NSJ-177 TaxID=2931401 RepID=UPI001FD1A471|nr:hypothetical protein [Cuneatibacter sp. NSJ-177]